MEGTLFIVGGGLIQSADEVFAELIRRAGGANGRFAFIVSASGMDPDDTFRSYRDDFVRLGAREENCVLVPLYAPHVRDERGYNAFTGDAEGRSGRLVHGRGPVLHRQVLHTRGWHRYQAAYKA